MCLRYLTRSGFYQNFVEVKLGFRTWGLPWLLELHIRYLLSNPKAHYENEKCWTFLHQKHDRAFLQLKRAFAIHPHAKCPPLKSKETLRPSHLWRKGALSWVRPNFEAYALVLPPSRLQPSNEGEGPLEQALSLKQLLH